MTPISRREREILDCVYQLGQPTAKEVMLTLADSVSYSTIRTQLRNLVEKGWLTRQEQGLKYIYIPKVDRASAARRDLKRLLTTYFADSPIKAVNSFLDMNKGAFSEEELEQLERLVHNERKELTKNK